MSSHYLKLNFDKTDLVIFPPSNSPPLYNTSTSVNTPPPTHRALLLSANPYTVSSFQATTMDMAKRSSRACQCTPTSPAGNYSVAEHQHSNTMRTFQFLHVFLILLFAIVKGGQNRKTRPFLKHYETLSYDQMGLHQRTKRTANEEEKIIHLDLVAYNRTFALMLKRDNGVFTDDFQVVSLDQHVPMDISFVYTGRLRDEEDSYCHGSIIDGYFHGSIKTGNGTFYVEYEENNKGSNESYIYHESDIDYSLLKDVNSFDFALKKYQMLENFKWKPKEESVIRSKRSLDLSRTTCLLHVKADYFFFKSFRSLQSAISHIAEYLTSVNAIFWQTNFNGIKYIHFRVKTLHIVEEEEPDSPMNSLYIGPEKLLMLHSKSNWNSFCLSYLLTNRDYNGLLGLAWIGRSGNAGGICSKFSKMQDNPNTKASLNTGIVTIQKYGQYLPPRIIHITLAHELGHSFGSPHDESEECTQFTAASPNGNYLMFPYAVDGSQYNNDKFSPCSIHYMSSILKLKMDQCFVESGRPMCGNQIVEEGEECDVGSNDNDTCCYSVNAGEGLQCTLKPGKECSPSQGECCSQLCTYKPKGEQCRDEAECTYGNYCLGDTAKCPNPAPKDNYTLCRYGTRICLNGMCSQSVCVKFGLEQCDCNTDNLYEKCQLCCQKPGDVYSCRNTKSAELSQLFSRFPIVLPPGAPCGQRQGYCDKFHVCRLVDADGPIARLKNSFLKFIEQDPAAWMKTRWWLILIVILTMAAIMAGTVFIFGRTLDSSKVALQKESSKRKSRQLNTCHKEEIAWEREELYMSAVYESYKGGEDMEKLLDFSLNNTVSKPVRLLHC
ncbi:disintegrin and metalloproteinase domain-containing protein 10-like [Gastrophryne carolinensis]